MDYNEHCKICTTKLCCFCSYKNTKENTELGLAIEAPKGMYK